MALPPTYHLVEDHPFDYKDFEGIIPKGQYGGGTADPARVSARFQKVIDACAADGVVIEVNAHHYRLDMDGSHIILLTIKAVPAYMIDRKKMKFFRLFCQRDMSKIPLPLS